MNIDLLILETLERFLEDFIVDGLPGKRIVDGDLDLDLSDDGNDPGRVYLFTSTAQLRLCILLICFVQSEICYCSIDFSGYLISIICVTLFIKSRRRSISFSFWCKSQKHV